MKPFIILLLAYASALGAETDIHFFSSAQTNDQNVVIYRKDVFTRDGLTNLIRITRIDPRQGEVRACHFYHAGQLVGNFVAFPQESIFNTEAGPYCMSLKYGPAGEIRSAMIGDKDGVLVDEFSCTNSVFIPMQGPLRQNGLMKPKFAFGSLEHKEKR